MTTKLDRDLERLFILNRAVPDVAAYAEILELEESWIIPRVRDLEETSPSFSSRAEVMTALKELLRDEEGNPAKSSLFLAGEATRDQFRTVVAQFAVDGLTEAQSFLPIIARLPHRSQMAVLRVLIDEFGCGNIEQSHSELYRKLLAELDLPVEVEPFIAGTCAEVYAFVNLFHWLAARAPQTEYFLGALAYLEASILYAFKYFADGCARLEIQNGHYYTEHLHIDNFHMKEMQTAIRELDAAQGIDGRKVWVGIQLASEILGAAVDAAVEKARSSA